MNTFQVNIEGYWRERHKENIPDHSGIYFVYEAKHEKEHDTIKLIQLIYIGFAKNVNASIESNSQQHSWTRFIHQGNELCYSTGYVEEANGPRIAAAYAVKHKPLASELIKFSFDETKVLSVGKTALLDASFNVEQI